MAWRPGHPLPAPSLPSPRMKQTTDHTPSHAAPSAPDSLEQLRVQYARDRGRWIGSLLAPTMGRRGVRLVLQLPPGAAVTGRVQRDWARPLITRRRS